MSIPKQEFLPRLVIATTDDELWHEVERVLDCEFTLHHLKTGREVVEAVESQAVNLVLLDMRIAHPRAKDVLYLLKKNGETLFVPIVAMSGTQTHEDLMHIGADASLTHPFSFDALFQRIATVVLN